MTINFMIRNMQFFVCSFCFKILPKIFFVGIFVFSINLLVWNMTDHQFNVHFKDSNQVGKKLRVVTPSYESQQWLKSFAGPEKHESTGVEVMINTYMRSGSTFFGKVLGQRSDTFYMYEPLWSLSRYAYYSTNGTKCIIFNQVCIDSGELEIAFKVLFQFYGCNFYTYPMLRFFKPNIHVKLSGKKWDVYTECMNRNFTMETCLQIMSTNACANSQHKVAKVLRISLENLKSFLEVRPNLKIVHLFRDPRAVINSHIRIGWSPVRATSLVSVASTARSVCDRMADDIKYAKKLKTEFPERFLVLQYEDFKDPLPKIRKLYDFVGMNFTNEAYEFIDMDTNMTSGSKLNGNHPFLYREQLEWHFVKVINRYCSHVYKELGYTMFGSEEDLTDLDIEPVTSPLPYALR